MNTKQLEYQAKALAPVIRDFVNSAVLQAKAELKEAHEAEISRLNTEYIEKLDEVTKSIPSPIDRAALIAEIKELIPTIDIDGLTSDIKASIPEIDNTQFISAVDAGLLVEERAITLIEEFNSVVDDIKKTIEPVVISSFMPNIEEKIAEKIAEIPTPTNGADGINGRDGNDALHIEILPSIDFEKSYPRGTYGMINGGVMRSYQQTQGEKGWDTAWNGIASIDTTMKDARTVSIVSILTDGTRDEKTFSLPTMIYRGVFKDGDDYQCGDVATFGGSLWHCDKETKEKPGTSNSWTLAAKKGRDGK